MLSQSDARAAAIDMIDYWHFSPDQFLVFAPNNFILKPDEIHQVKDCMEQILDERSSEKLPDLIL